MTRKITRISCRFYAGEFDDDGRMTNELPVASSGQEFNAIIYHPFTLPLETIIGQIEEAINERDGSSGEEPGLPAGVSGVSREAGADQAPSGASGGPESGDESGGPQDPEVAGGGSHQAPGERGLEQEVEPAGDPGEGEPEEGGSLTENGIIIRSANWEAAPLIIASSAEEGVKMTDGDVVRFLSSTPFFTDDAKLLVAYVMGKPQGVILVSRYRSASPPYYEISRLYVNPHARGRQIAIKLIKAAVSWVKGEDDTPIYITSKGMPRSFYTSLGFIPTHTLCVSNLGKVKEALGL